MDEFRKEDINYTLSTREEEEEVVVEEVVEEEEGGGGGESFIHERFSVTAEAEMI